MTRMTAKDFDQDLLDLYDFYAHGRISKREFLDRAGKWAVGGLTAGAILGMLSPDYALAQQVAEDDDDLMFEEITYDSPNGNGQVNAYLVQPFAPETPPAAVLVVHENRGLNPYIRDVTRRVAKAGFIAMAPDGLTSVGGYPGNDDEGRDLQTQVDPELLMNDFFAGYEHLAAMEGSNGKVGATGFCYGGGVVNALAVAYPELSAGVPFYGRQPAAADVPKIEAPLLLQYAALDSRINEGWPAYQKALEENDKRYEALIWPEVNHGFHNDTTPRYDAEAAEAAWEKTIAWFRVYLA
ncbi:YghX family hydrolase [uncultured Jannaschia sp.]|uniref:YghX family hydrolase n=1 Tax=uncultured Jannaschia sp. TaxID=293347 RepID=UPI002605A8B0|nr:YghX family hydrolase [uncultured Jannaschia sp.]